MPRCMCLLLEPEVSRTRGPLGLGHPWRLQEVGDVGHGLPLRGPRGRRTPNRGWVDRTMATASPRPFPGCPDVL
eukprot:9149283-Pyramimonas_sp.AAC.1